MNLSWINSKEEYMSMVKMNISRINSEGRIAFISTIYWAEYHK
jgi:hypothetical protein